MTIQLLANCQKTGTAAEVARTRECVCSYWGTAGRRLRDISRVLWSDDHAQKKLLCYNNSEQVYKSSAKASRGPQRSLVFEWAVKQVSKIFITLMCFHQHSINTNYWVTLLMAPEWHD